MESARQNDLTRCLWRILSQKRLLLTILFIFSTFSTNFIHFLGHLWRDSSPVLSTAQTPRVARVRFSRRSRHPATGPGFAGWRARHGLAPTCRARRHSSGGLVVHHHCSGSFLASGSRRSRVFASNTSPFLITKRRLSVFRMSSRGSRVSTIMSASLPTETVPMSS